MPYNYHTNPSTYQSFEDRIHSALCSYTVVLWIKSFAAGTLLLCNVDSRALALPRIATYSKVWLGAVFIFSNKSTPTSKVSVPCLSRTMLKYWKYSQFLVMTFQFNWSWNLYLSTFAPPSTPLWIMWIVHGKKSSTRCNVVEIKQCCAAHTVQGCQQHWTTLLHAIQPQQYCSMLLKTINNVGSKTLFNHVMLQAHIWSFDIWPMIRVTALASSTALTSKIYST